MKYIDATTQNSLKQGVMELLDLSAGEMIQMFMSIYEDTEKEPWEWVRDFLSEHGVNETLELSITLKFCTFFTPKKCTGTTDVSLRVNHLFPLSGNFHQLSLQLLNDAESCQVLQLISYCPEIYPAILQNSYLL